LVEDLRVELVPPAHGVQVAARQHLELEVDERSLVLTRLG
jgi:hypothetical protein